MDIVPFETDKQWKPISVNGINFGYLISDHGDVWSQKRKMSLNPQLSSGYKYVLLSYEGGKFKYSIHRLVAIMFLDNPNNLDYVNHKNGDRLDNRAVNLEWVSPAENRQHAIEVLEVSGLRVGVDQYSLDGTRFIAHYESISAAASYTNGSASAITFACQGKYHTSGGFTWRYSDATRLLTDPEPEGARLPDHPNYIITNSGKIYSLTFGKYRALQTDKNGYQCVSLCTDGKRQNFVVHVLVARFFVPNPDPVNKIYVNHINGKRDDNDYRNLEWVTQSENILHAYNHGGLAKILRPVIQLDDSGDEIERFPSASEAARIFGVTPSAIFCACTTGGYCCKFKWQYAEAATQQIPSPLEIVPAVRLDPEPPHRHLTLKVISNPQIGTPQPVEVK